MVDEWVTFCRPMFEIYTVNNAKIDVKNASFEQEEIGHKVMPLYSLTFENFYTYILTRKIN